MGEEKKVHVIITMETFGEQYQKIEVMNSGTTLDSVKELQGKLAEALLSLNK